MNLYRCLAQVLCFLVATHGGAVWASRLQTYQLGPAACSFEIAAKKNSYVYQNGDFYSHLIEHGGPRADGLNFNFKCTVQHESENYCRERWWQSLLPEDASSLKIINVRYYEDVHPRYSSIVYSSNVTAVAEPRPRLIHFCLSSETRAIEGSVYVGSEKNYRVQPALAILKTIKIR